MTTTTYIIIDKAVYETGTDEQREAARIALAEAGVSSAPVYAGAPDCPDSYRNGDVLFAAEED